MDLGDLFATEEDLLQGTEGHILSHYDRRPRNCAWELQLPQMKRVSKGLVGLSNQGATCYLNSLIQCFFTCPDFRAAILALPLKQDFTGNPDAFNLLLAFQQLFAEMQMLDSGAVVTTGLTKAFRWQSGEQNEQNDIQEAMRIICDALQKSLAGSGHDVVRCFRGSLVSYLRCQFCATQRERMEMFYDLGLQVLEMRSIQDSLSCFLTPEVLGGDNKVYCQMCGQKQVFYKGYRFKDIPDLLVLSLKRFNFNYQTFARVRLNTCMQFSLQLSLTQITQSATPQDFELISVLVHSGSADSGHYLMYCRDIIGEVQVAPSNQPPKPEKAKQAKDEHKMRQPQNKQLTDKWFCINDSIVHPVSYKELATQFSGSQSAYILIYRRANLPVPICQVPPYLDEKIHQRNLKISEYRQFYDNQKNHVELVVEGQKIRVHLDVNGGQFCLRFGQAVILVEFDQKPNGFTHYLKAIQNSQPGSLRTLEVSHLSEWKIMSPENYSEIKKIVGQEFAPLKLLVLSAGVKREVKAYANSTLLQFRLQLEQQLLVSYQQQVIKILNDDGSVSLLNCDSDKEELTLARLRVFDLSDLVLQTIETAKTEQLQEGQSFHILVQRDDQPGVKRLFLPPDTLLSAALETATSKFGLASGENRRFKLLLGNRIFTKGQYDLKLTELKFDQQGTRLRLQRGLIPQNSQITIFAKFKETIQKTVEVILDQTQTIAECKQKACAALSLDPEQYKVYKTDWQGDPVQLVANQKNQLYNSGISNNSIVVVLHNSSSIPAQFCQYQLYLSKDGTPSNCTFVCNFKIHQELRVQQLKLQIMSLPALNLVFGAQTDSSKVRLRQLRKDYFFGSILKDEQQILKKLKLNSNKLVAQPLAQPEKLDNDDLVIVLKKRDSKARQYVTHQDFVVKKSKVLQYQQFYRGVREYLKLQDSQQLLLIKYFSYQFQWVPIQKQFKLHTKGDKGKKGKNAQQQGKQKGKQKQKQKQKGKNNIESQKAKQKQKEQIKTVAQQKKQGEKQTQKQGSKPQREKAKKQKKPEQLAKDEQKKKNITDLKKPPYLLKEGDFIGYLVGGRGEDDLQTAEDTQLKVLKTKQLKAVAKKAGKQKGFRLNLNL